MGWRRYAYGPETINCVFSSGLMPMRQDFPMRFQQTSVQAESGESDGESDPADDAIRVVEAPHHPRQLAEQAGEIGVNDPGENGGDPDDAEKTADRLGRGEVGIGAVAFAHLVNQSHDAPPIGGQQHGQNQGR